MNKVQTFLKWTFKAIFWVVAVFVLIFVIVAALIQIPAIQKQNYSQSHFICQQQNSYKD